MPKTLGFGILGAGLVAPFHAKAITHSRNARLVAFADMQADRVGTLAAEYTAKAYPSLDVMLNDPAIDVVNVCLPNHLHCDGPHGDSPDQGASPATPRVMRA